MASGESLLLGALDSEDTDYLRSALRALGMYCAAIAAGAVVTALGLGIFKKPMSTQAQAATA